MAQDNIVKELPVSSSTVLPVFKMCVGCSSVMQHRGEAFRGKCFLSCLSPIKHLVDGSWFVRIFVASPCDLEYLLLSRCSYTSPNTWPSQASVPSGLFSPIVTAPQGSNLPGCTKRGSQCIHFISLTLAVWDYYRAVYKWSAILTATIAFSRGLQLQRGYTATVHCMGRFRFYLFYWLLNATGRFK